MIPVLVVVVFSVYRVKEAAGLLVSKLIRGKDKNKQ